MGPGAAQTTAGRALMRALRRAVRDMTEEELRVNLTDIRDRLSTALEAPHAVTVPEPIVALHDASHDLSAVAAGD
jgi:Flp pilus assembly protein TadB